jgi:protein O-mannosyl-transferase
MSRDLPFRSWRRPAGSSRAALALVLAVTAAAYARVLGGEFVFDDASLFLPGSGILNGASFVRDTLTRGWYTLERPLTDLSFAVQYALSGANTWAFHFTNLVLHLACVCLVHRLTTVVCRGAGIPPERVAIFVAALFALHPMQSQSVAYVSQRAEVMASLLYVAAVLLIIDPLFQQRRLAARTAALVVFVLALGAKTIAITLPAAVLLLVASEAPGRRWRDRLFTVAPFFGVAAVVAASRLLMLESHGDVGFNVGGGITPFRYLLAQITTIPRYVRLLVFPAGQTIHHDIPLPRSPFDAGVLLSAGVLGCMIGIATFLAIRSRGGNHPRSRITAIGIAWFFVLLAPTSSFVPLKDLAMEHRVYLACWGLFLAAGVGLDWIVQNISNRGRLVVTSAVGVMLLTLAVTLYARNAVWESQRALWSDAAAKAPNVARPWAGLAGALRDEGDRAGALQSYQRALALGDVSVPRHETLGNIASMLLEKGRDHEAISLLREALELKPGEPGILASLALAHLRVGEGLRAEEYARAGVAAAPMLADSHRTLGGVLGQTGDYAGALAEFSAAAALAPNELEHVFNIALALERLSRRDEACAQLRRCAETRDERIRARASQLGQRLQCTTGKAG